MGCARTGEEKRVPSSEGTRWWAGKDLNLRRLSQRIYSPPPLATWVPAQDAATIIPIPGKLSTPGPGFAIERPAGPRLPIPPRQMRLRRLAGIHREHERCARAAKNRKSVSRADSETRGLGFASQEEASRIAQVLGQAPPGIGVHRLAPQLPRPQVESPVGLVPLAHHQLGWQGG